MSALPGYVGVITADGDKAVYALSEWLAGPKHPKGDKAVYLYSLERMLAWSEREGHRIAPKPVPDEHQIARIAEMLTRND